MLPVQEEGLNISSKKGNGIVVCTYQGICAKFNMSFISSNSNFCDLYMTGWHVCASCTKKTVIQCYTCPNSFCSSCIGKTKFIPLRKGKGLCQYCIPLITMIEQNLTIDSDGVSFLKVSLLLLNFISLNVKQKNCTASM